MKISPAAPAPTARALHVAWQAAHRAGEMIRAGWSQAQAIEEKGIGDLVSQIDIDCDRAIQKEIRSAYPDDVILSEEISPDATALPERFWVVDPLDATSAFLFRVAEDMPSVMIALCEAGQTPLALVHFPLTAETFYAAKGYGAYRDGVRLRCTSALLSEAWIELNQYAHAKYESPVFRRLQESLRQSGGARLVTSGTPYSGISLRIAEGRKKLSAVVHDNNPARIKQAPWDVIPPSLILQEAGGVVVNLRGQAYDPFKPEPFVMAASRSLAEDICRLGR